MKTLTNSIKLFRNLCSCFPSLSLVNFLQCTFVGNFRNNFQDHRRLSEQLQDSQAAIGKPEQASCHNYSSTRFHRSKQKLYFGFSSQKTVQKIFENYQRLFKRQCFFIFRTFNTIPFMHILQYLQYVYCCPEYKFCSIFTILRAIEFSKRHVALMLHIAAKIKASEYKQWQTRHYFPGGQTDMQTYLAKNASLIFFFLLVYSPHQHQVKYAKTRDISVNTKHWLVFLR